MGIKTADYNHSLRDVCFKEETLSFVHLLKSVIDVWSDSKSVATRSRNDLSVFKVTVKGH